MIVRVRWRAARRRLQLPELDRFPAAATPASAGKADTTPAFVTRQVSSRKQIRVPLIPWAEPPASASTAAPVLEKPLQIRKLSPVRGPQSTVIPWASEAVASSEVPVAAWAAPAQTRTRNTTNRKAVEPPALALEVIAEAVNEYPAYVPPVTIRTERKVQIQNVYEVPWATGPPTTTAGSPFLAVAFVTRKEASRRHLTLTPVIGVDAATAPAGAATLDNPLQIHRRNIRRRVEQDYPPVYPQPAAPDEPFAALFTPTVHRRSEPRPDVSFIAVILSNPAQPFPGFEPWGHHRRHGWRKLQTVTPIDYVDAATPAGQNTHTLAAPFATRQEASRRHLSAISAPWISDPAPAPEVPIAALVTPQVHRRRAVRPDFETTEVIVPGTAAVYPSFVPFPTFRSEFKRTRQSVVPIDYVDPYIPPGAGTAKYEQPLQIRRLSRRPPPQVIPILWVAPATPAEPALIECLKANRTEFDRQRQEVIPILWVDRAAPNYGKVSWVNEKTFGFNVPVKQFEYHTTGHTDEFNVETKQFEHLVEGKNLEKHR